jgi:hypothetical protein
MQSSLPAFCFSLEFSGLAFSIGDNCGNKQQCGGQKWPSALPKIFQHWDVIFCSFMGYLAILQRVMVVL